MNRNKLGKGLIIVIFIVLIWTIAALAVPAVKDGTYWLFVELIGGNLVRGATGLGNAIMLWGSQSFTQAATVLLGDGVLFLLLGLGFSRLIWPRIHGEKKTPAQTLPITPLQDQLSKPALPPVTKEEVTS